jgi:hypothetical protein
MTFLRKVPLLPALMLAWLLASAPKAEAQSLIPFDQAVATAEVFVPAIEVTKVEYALDPVTLTTIVRVFGPTAKLDVGWTMEFDAVTGTPLNLSAAALTDFERATLAIVLSRRSLGNMTFSEAAQLAATSLGQPLIQVRSVSMVSQHTLLVLLARFADLSTVNVDAIARVRLADGFEGEPVARGTSAQLSSAIGSVEAQLPGWRFLRARAVSQSPALVLDICMLEPVKNIARQARVTLGSPNSVVLSQPFMPRGTLAEDAALRRNPSISIPSTVHEALARMHASATNVRFFDFRFSAVAGQPRWCGSCDSPNVFLSAEFTMFLTATQPAATGFIYGRREFAMNPADFNRDALISAMDLAEVLNSWGVYYPPYDLNESGLVDAGDLAILLNGWR